MDVDDRLQRLAARKSDVMEEAAAQERVGQFLLVVRGDDDDRALDGAHRLAGFVYVEFHPIEFLEQIVVEYDIGLVALVDPEEVRGGCGERPPQFALSSTGEHQSALQSLKRISYPVLL